jgi:hypothetical protein
MLLKNRLFSEFTGGTGGTGPLGPPTMYTPPPARARIRACMAGETGWVALPALSAFAGI